MKPATRHGAAMRTTLVVIAGLLAAPVPSWSDEVYGGVGIDVGWFEKPHGLEIYHVHPNSAAEKAGLYRYQQIRSIDGVTTEGKTSEECKRLLRGKVGSTVTLTLVDPLVGETNTVAFLREKIEVVDVSRDTVVKTN